jgi:hypothetical protein
MPSAPVTRLPVQHRRAPHCPSCKAPLPTFDGMSLTLMGETDVELLAITFHVRCKCGSVWDLKKGAK